MNAFSTQIAAIHCEPASAGTFVEKTFACEFPATVESVPKSADLRPEMPEVPTATAVNVGTPPPEDRTVMDQSGGVAPIGPFSNDGFSSSVLIGPDMVPSTSHCASCFVT